MFELPIYCDEAGTMPVSDSDDVFVTVAIAVGEPHWLVNFPQRPSNPRWTAAGLAGASAYPGCTYVRPFPGYGALLARRMEQRNTLALSMRRLDGKNEHYVPADGVRPVTEGRGRSRSEPGEIGPLSVLSSGPRRLPRTSL